MEKVLKKWKVLFSLQHLPLWKEVVRPTLDPPSSANIPHHSLELETSWSQKQVPEGIGNQVHLLPRAQDVCSFLPEKKSC